MILGLDDSSDSSDDDSDDGVVAKSETDDLLDADNINLKIAVAAAEQNMEANCKSLQQADELVDERINMLLDESSSSCVSRTDLENEAFLQEVLLKSLTRAAGSTDASLSAKDTDSKVCLSAIQGDIYCDKCMNSVMKTMSALQFRKDQSTREIGEDKELSLILDPGHDNEANNGISVVFVQWSTTSSAKVFEGRPINLDEDRKVICPVNFIQTSRMFRHCCTILPAAGTHVRRVKKKDRPSVPKHSLRLFDIFTAALVAQSNSGPIKDSDMLLDDATVVGCHACSGPCDAQMQCSFCLLTCHPQCQDKLVTYIETLEEGVPGVSSSNSSASSSDLPSDLRNRLLQMKEFCQRCMSVEHLHNMFLGANSDTENAGANTANTERYLDCFANADTNRQTRIKVKVDFD